MAARLTGELKTWHKTTLEFVSDVTFKEDTSTFRDYRLDVTFTHVNTGKTITVPGFFAADGKAADSNATSGKIWQVNFNAPLDGKWSYDASFRTGNDIAASTAAKAGKAVGYIDGESGTFRIAETDKSGEDFRAKGMIVQDEGTHYLQHQGDGDYFVRGGPGIPENFLATSDIDNTVGTLDYKTHSSDFDKGGPTWDGGKGKNLIGAIDYLAEQGQNSIYLLTLTAAGDGKDVWPWAATNLDDLAKDTKKLNPDITSVYDVSKLAQWEKVFDHMDEKGIYKNVLLQERENDQLLDGGTDASGTSLSVERMIYMREMVARFGHNNGIQWNLGEENTNTSQQRVDMSEWMKAVDPYDHLVVVHTWPTEVQTVYNPLLGEEAFDGSSFQASSDDIRGLTETYRDKSAAAGDPWVIGWDENSTRQTMIDPYSNNPNSTKEQNLREAFWGFLTAGGSGVNWYIRQQDGQSYDQTMDTFDAFESLWTWTSAGTTFFNTYIPFWDMHEANSLTPNGKDYVMADPGQYYMSYLPYGEADNVKLDLRGQSGVTFDIYWYNPRTGGSLIADGSVSGGAVVDIGDAPSSKSKDWVVLARNSDLPGKPKLDGSQSQNDADKTAPVPEPDTSTGSVIAKNDSATVDAGGSERIDVLGNDSGDGIWIGSYGQGNHGSVEKGGGGTLVYTPDQGFLGTDSFSYTTLGSEGAAEDTATVTITVTGEGGAEAPVPEPDTSTGSVIAKNDSATVDAGGSERIDVLGNDSGDGIWIGSYGQGNHGSVEKGGGGTLVYTPDQGFLGTDSFSYTTLGSEGAAEDTATVTITVTGEGGAEAPVPEPDTSTGSVIAKNDSATVDAGGSERIDVLGNDSGDGIWIGSYGQGNHGSVEKGGGGTLVYAPDKGFTGTDSFSYTTLGTDGGKDMAVVTVAVGGEVAKSQKEPEPPKAFVAPFDLSGPNIEVEDVFLFGFGVDGKAAAVKRSGGEIGVEDVGSATEIDYRSGLGSEKIGFDFGIAANGITLDLDKVNTVDGADEAAIFRTYDTDGNRLQKYVLTGEEPITLNFDQGVRFATLHVSQWIGDGAPSFDPDIVLEGFDLIA